MQAGSPATIRHGTREVDLPQSFETPASAPPARRRRPEPPLSADFDDHHPAAEVIVHGPLQPITNTVPVNHKAAVPRSAPPKHGRSFAQIEGGLRIARETATKGEQRLGRIERILEDLLSGGSAAAGRAVIDDLRAVSLSVQSLRRQLYDLQEAERILSAEAEQTDASKFEVGGPLPWHLLVIAAPKQVIPHF
jgi:hypothetical protein